MYMNALERQGEVEMEVERWKSGEVKKTISRIDASDLQWKKKKGGGREEGEGDGGKESRPNTSIEENVQEKMEYMCTT